jgi:hypothetical protein
MWYNKRYDRVGPLFQGRYKSIPIEDSAWGYQCSLYVHANPVARAEYGLDPWSKKAEALGWKEPGRDEASSRLKELRSYRWSSYRAYAGYCTAPDWLTTKEILRRAGGNVGEQAARYRRDVEQRLTKGVEETFMARLKEGVALGTAGYVEKIRDIAQGCSRDIAGRKQLRKRISYDQMVSIVEEICGEDISDMMARRGGHGKPLLLWAARQYCGMTLKEIGVAAGGMDYNAVSMAISRFTKESDKNRDIAILMKQCGDQACNV